MSANIFGDVHHVRVYNNRQELTSCATAVPSHYTMQQVHTAAVRHMSHVGQCGYRIYKGDKCLSKNIVQLEGPQNEQK